MIPSDTVQGAAAATAMADRRIGRVGVVDATGSYGDSLISGFESVARSPEIASGGSVDAIYAVGPGPVHLPGRADAATAFGADAQIEGSPPRTTMPDGATVISGTMAAEQLPGGGAGSRRPGRFSAYGYEAMAVVLDSIDRAGDPLDRASVIDAFFATTDRESILGTYSIDDVGDTTLSRVGTYEARRGGALVPEPKPITVP